MSLSPSNNARDSGHLGSKLKLLDLSEQLIVSAMPVMDKIPRMHRYRYGAAIEKALYELPNLVIQASTAKTKTKVYSLYDHIEYIHSLLRIGAERKIISRRWVGHIMRSCDLEVNNNGLLKQISAMCAVWRASIKESGK